MYKYFKYFLVLGIFCACNNPTENTIISGDNNGKKLFEMHCSTCHGKSGDAKIGSAANLKTSALTEHEIYQTIGQGKNTMPSYTGILSEDEILDITKYVMTLRND